MRILRHCFTTCMVAVFILGLIWGPIAAQSGMMHQDDIPGRSMLVDTSQSTHVAAEANVSSIADLTLGQPGTAYRYLRTFGTLDEPYLVDNLHLNFPWGITTDGNNVWIAESFGRRLLKFSHDGSFITSIGNAGLERFQDQTMGWLADVAVDGDGNIWTADGNTSHVLKFDAAGNVLAKLGETYNSGSDNSQFGQAGPASIAFDNAGNVYISDGVQWWSTTVGNQRIQIFDSSGTYLATLGTTGMAGSGNNQFQGPRHITVVDTSLYVADAGNHRVQVFDISNPLIPAYAATIGTTGEPGNDNTHLNEPSGVAVDANFIYVADLRNQRVQIFDRTTRAYVATIGGNQGSSNQEFHSPSDVAVDTDGRIYVADMSNLRVQQFNPDRSYTRTYGVTGVPYITDGAHFNEPSGVAIGQDSSIYITEFGGHRLVKLDASGSFQWAVGIPGRKNVWYEVENGVFDNPQDVAIGPNGHVYVADKWYSRVQVFDVNGDFLRSKGSEGGLNCPDGLFVANDGFVYVADTCNQRVIILDTNLNEVATLGTLGEVGTDNAHFSDPLDVVVDSQGTIYVADHLNHRVQVFDSNRNYVRTIGITAQQGSDFTSLAGPRRLFIDRDDRLYVVDGWNNRVQVFDATGAYLTTIGGSWGNRSSQLRGPSGIAVDLSGNVYVTDFANHRIQMFAPGYPRWSQQNINAFGDRTNGNLHSLATFGEHLYAGTYNEGGNGAQLWRMNVQGQWSQVAEPGFGLTRTIGLNVLLPFKNNLYAGVRNDVDGGHIYRSSNGTTWAPVVTGGFGDQLTTGIYQIVEFDGQIYAGTSIFTTTHGAEVWRSPTGDSGTWTRVVENGFDSTNNYIIRSAAVHSGTLYFGTQNIDTSTYMTTTGGIIVRSSSGDADSWSKVIDNGFGNINNSVVSGLASFGGYLYAATGSWDWRGAEVWRCQQCDSPSDWVKVVDNGFGNRNNWGIGVLVEHEGELYLLLGNGIDGMEVWRTESGESGTWNRVASGGFGDSNNTSPYNTNATIFNQALYIGANNGANGPEIWKYFDNGLYAPTILR